MFKDSFRYFFPRRDILFKEKETTTSTTLIREGKKPDYFSNLYENIFTYLITFLDERTLLDLRLTCRWFYHLTLHTLTAHRSVSIENLNSFTNKNKWLKVNIERLGALKTVDSHLVDEDTTRLDIDIEHDCAEKNVLLGIKRMYKVKLERLQTISVSITTLNTPIEFYHYLNQLIKKNVMLSTLKVYVFMNHLTKDKPQSIQIPQRIQISESVNNLSVRGIFFDNFAQILSFPQKLEHEMQFCKVSSNVHFSRDNNSLTHLKMRNVNMNMDLSHYINTLESLSIDFSHGIVMTDFSSFCKMKKLVLHKTDLSKSELKLPVTLESLGIQARSCDIREFVINENLQRLCIELPHNRGKLPFGSLKNVSELTLAYSPRNFSLLENSNVERFHVYAHPEYLRKSSIPKVVKELRLDCKFDQSMDLAKYDNLCKLKFTYYDLVPKFPRTLVKLSIIFKRDTLIDIDLSSLHHLTTLELDSLYTHQHINTTLKFGNGINGLKNFYLTGVNVGCFKCENGFEIENLWVLRSKCRSLFLKSKVKNLYTRKSDMTVLKSSKNGNVSRTLFTNLIRKSDSEIKWNFHRV